MDLNKHVVNNNNGKPFFSNGFAAVANSNGFGSTSNTSFEQRRQIDQNRHAVTGYQRSTIGTSYSQARINPVSGGVDRRTRSLSKSQMQQLKQLPGLPRVQL